MNLNERSRRNLEGVHPDLVSVLEATDFEHAVIVTEGVRTMQRQEQLLAEGKSKTVNSRHLTGHAVDLAVVVDGQVTWEWSHYARLAKAMKSAAKQVGIQITWGGDWTSFKDGTHVQLAWDAYPLTAKPKTAGNSKTVATAAVGIPVAAFMGDVFDQLGGLITWLEGVDETIVSTIKVAAVVGVVLFIVNERMQKASREGV